MKKVVRPMVQRSDHGGYSNHFMVPSGYSGDMVTKPSIIYLLLSIALTATS